MRGGLRLLSQERLLLRAVLSRVGTIAQALEWDDCPVHDTQDNGIDLMAQTAGAGEWWAIQCKRYDGGAVYMGREWREACGPGVRRSMSRRARSPDNARAEGFFGTLKCDFFEGRDWTGVPFEEFSRPLLLL